MKLLAIASLAAVSLGCGAAQAQSLIVAETSSTASGPSLERLYFARATDEFIRVRVASNGCTTEESFNVEVTPQDDGSYLVALARVEADTCKRSRPNGQFLTFERDEIGVPADAEVEFANPVRRERI